MLTSSSIIALVMLRSMKLALFQGRVCQLLHPNLQKLFSSHFDRDQALAPSRKYLLILLFILWWDLSDR